MHILGFESIAGLELDDEPYSYNLIGLWRNAEGFFLGTDSGCSCPTPWESHTASDLTGPLTLDQVAEETVNLWNAAGRKVDEEMVQKFLNAAVGSFLRVTVTDWVVQDHWDLPDCCHRFATEVRDAHGIKWTRTAYDVDFVAGDNAKDGSELDYPVTVLAVKKD